MSVLLLVISSGISIAQSQYRSNAITMNWSAAGSWQTWNGTNWVTATTYPGENSATGDVTIQDGHTVTIDVSPAEPITRLYVGEGASGILQYEATTPRTLSVSEIVTVNPNAVFRSALTGEVTTHQLLTYGSIVNNGTINFSTNSNNSGVGITFTGTGNLDNEAFDLRGATLTNLRSVNGVVLDKGNNVLSFLPGGQFQVLSANAAGFLTIQSGTFSLMGINTFSNPLFYASTGSYTIPSGGCFQLNNHNAVVMGLNGTLTNNGTIIIRDGTFNIGTSMGNELLTTNTGQFEMSGGVMNISGRFRNDGGECNITGGTLNLATIGHADSRLAAFYMSDISSLTISGNPLITFAHPNTNPTHFNDIEIVSGAGLKTITGGTFQMGTSAITDRPFLINSNIPIHNLEVFNRNIRVSLAGNLTINNVLTLNGKLLLNNYNLNLGVAAIGGTHSASDGMIVSGLGTGEVRKMVNPNGSYSFPFGNGSDYLPVILSFTGGTFMPDPTVSVRMVDSKQPQNTNTTNYLTRYWKVGISGINNPIYNFTGTYTTGDVIGQEGWMTTGIFTTSWTKLTASGNIGTTIQAKGLTGNLDITGINSATAPTVKAMAVPATVCSGSSSQLTTNATGDAPFIYSWTPAAGLSATNVANPEATPTTNTTYTVTVTDRMGGSAAATATVTVNPLPTATITGTVELCQNAASPPITFTGALGTAPYTFTYRINGGDNQTVTSTGNSATVPVPTETQGEFVYSLVSVQDARCSQVQTGTATVTVNPLPQITASSNSPQCVGNTLTLTASGGVTYHWTGPNGYISTEQNPSRSNVTTNTAGIYTVTVTDANGCVATASTTVIINPAPTVSITANPGGTICSGTNVTFTTRVNNAGSNPTYQWRINESPVTGETNSTFSTTALTNAQRVSVVVTVDPAYCSSAATSNIITMTVNDLVTPTVSILESRNNICAGTSVSFTSVVANGGSAPAYQWQINGTIVPAATGSTFSSSTLNDGDQVRVIVTSNATCVTSSTATSSAVTMVVNPVVTPSVTVSANPSTVVCPGTAITFTATPGNGGSNPVYQWFINNNPAGSGGPIFTSSTLANNDMVSVRMTSNASCVSQAIANSTNMTVTVNPGIPAVPAAITGNTVACPNSTETYTISQVLNATSYSWTVPIGWTIQNGQGTNTITVSTGNAGQNGTITVNAVNTCGTSGSRTLSVTTGSVSTAPAGITITNNNTCFGTSKTLTVNGGSLGTDANWQWYTGLCGGTLAGTGHSITVNPAVTTTYYVRAAGTCNTTECASNTVVVSPGAPSQPLAITGVATSVCPATSLTYSVAAVANVTSYNWIVPTGWTIASGQGTTVITVTTGSAGQNGNISVSAVNSCGSSTARTLAVTVAPGTPAAPGSITGNSDVCINSTGHTYSVAAVPNATSYTWTPPSGWNITSGQGTNSITLSTNGTASSGTIFVVAVNTCGTSSASTLPVYIVTAAPSTPGTINGLTAICPVKSVVCSIAPVQGAISYTWAVPTNWTISSGQGTVSITAQVPSNASSGNVTVVANNVCGSSPASSLPVSVANTAWVNAGIDQVVCQGTVSVTLNGSVGGAIKANQDKEWDWDVSVGSIVSPASLSTVYNLPNNGNTPGVYTVKILSNVSAVGCVQTQDEMTVTVMSPPTVNAGVDQTICRGSSVTLAGTIGGSASSATWSGGTGTFSPNANSLNAVYTPSPSEVAAGVINLTLTTDDPIGTCVAISDQLRITINPQPTVNAGADQIICTGSTVTLAGSVSGGGASIGTWSGGSGTYSPNNTSLNAVYTPSAAEIAAGTFTLTLTSDDPIGPCNSVSDQVTVTINSLPTVNAGADQTICAKGTVSLNGSVNGVVNSGSWSGGSGTYSPNNTSLNAVYTPSAAEIAAGTIILTLTSADLSGPCNAVSDQVSITINPLPIANAGIDQTVCASSTVTLAGTISGPVSAGTWSGGTGSFSNPASLTTVYTPSEEEISDGTVTLTLTSGDPEGPCGSVSDQVTIAITPAVTVSAGVDQDICEGSSAILRGSIGGAARSVTWSGGAGSFSNPTSLNTTYSPANGETGDITLTLTTDDPAGSCNAVSDKMVIHIYPRATVSAGGNQTICSNGTATMAGSFGGSATSGRWTTSGGGTFTNPTSPTALYTPGNSDISNGSVILTFTTDDPNGPCGPVSASMTLTINHAIQITSQPSNTGVCATYPADLTVAAVGNNPTYQWYRGTAPGGIPVVNTANITGVQAATLHFNNATLVDEGSYYVVISGAANCGAVTSNTVTLNVDQEITITTPVESNTVCVGDDVTFRIVAEPGGLLSFQWRKDGINIPNATGNTLTLDNVTVAARGSYDVLITGLAGYTCSSAVSSAAILTVNEDATIALNSAIGTDAQTGCISTPITNITYQLGGGATGARITPLPAGITHSYNSTTKLLTISGTPTVAGSYSYAVSTKGPCVNPTVNGTITMTPNSTITLSSAASTTSQTVCVSTAITPVTYAVGGSATGVTITGLPPGVTGSFNAGVLTISGTPTVAGSFNYTATTTGPCVNPTVNGTIQVNDNSTVILSSEETTTVQAVCIGTPIVNITYTIGGSATGVSVSGLPSGVIGVYNNATKAFTISGTSTVSGFYTYTVTTAGPCANTTSSGSITISPVTEPGVISPATPVVCSGSNNGTLTLSGYVGTIVRWESSTNGGATWNPIVNTSITQNYTNLTQSTLYRAVIQSGTCSVTYSAFANVIVISPYSPIITTNPTPPIICIGQSATLTASSGPLDAPFIGSFGNANPEGWRVNGSNNNFPSAPANEQPGPWGRATNDRTYYSVNYYSSGGPFSVVNGAVTSTLETPVFSLVGMTSAFFNTIQAIRLVNGASARIEISTDGGSTYNTILDQYAGPVSIGNNSGFTNSYWNLASFLGQTNLRIRYSFTGTVNSTWAIDDAIISATPGGNPYANLVSYTWSPSATLSSATGLSVTATPTVTTTYTLIASITAGGVSCQIGTNQVTVNVVPLPVVTAVNACVGGGPVTFIQVGAPAGGTWTRNGGGNINASTGVFTPTTAGRFTVTYTTPQGNCFDTESFVVFPAAPVLTAPANICAAALTLPAVPAVAGFNVEYSIDGGTYAAAPTTAVPGCHTIKARYVLAAAWGTNPAGTTAPVACAESNTVNVIIFPPAPSAPVVNSGCGPITVIAPPVVSGFDIQYSFDDGAHWDGNTPPTADNCTGYNIRTRYVIHDACGTQFAGAFSTVAGCDRSPATNRRIDTTLPVIATTAVNNANLGCNPTITAPVFTVTELCDANPIATVTTLGPTNIGCAYTQTWTAHYTDACDNAATPVTITYTWTQDLVAPVITCPINGTVTVAVNSGSSYLHSGTAWDATAIDNCAVYLIEYTLSGATNTPAGIHTSLDKVAFNTGTTTIKWTATDACENTSSCSFDVTVPGEVDIEVVKTGPATIAAGETITYTLTVTNLGPAQANSVTLADAVPPGITNVEYSANGGLAYQPWPGSLAYTDLLVGSDHAQTILIRGVADCPAAANSTLSNTATVTLSAPLVDPVNANNSSTIVTNLRDAQPPAFTLINNTLTYCVSSILWAAYNPNPTVGIVPIYNDITTPRPEYYLFTAGSKIFDLDTIANYFNDNCCPNKSLVLHWRIDFAPTPNPETIAHEMISHAPISGTGQPSLYSQNIEFPGDGVTFHDVIHQLTYWLVDCNNNTSLEQHVQIIIQPRPQLTKVN